MAYSVEIYGKAVDILKRRRLDAEYTAEQRKIEMNSKYPEFDFIQRELAKTGMEIVSAFSLDEPEAEKKLSEIFERNKMLREERAKLLKALKLPLDYFDVKYTCPKCSDTGFIEKCSDLTGTSQGTELCECHKELLKELSVKTLLDSTPLELCSFEDFDLDFYSKKKIDDLVPFNSMKTVYASCVKYAQTFDLDSVSLYFYGRTGLGKTHLSLSIANEVIKKGYTVLYGSVITFMNKIEKEKFGKAESTDTENMLIDVDLLILDDLGSEFTTSFTTSVLYNIINSRICRGVPTIISSNLDFRELRDRYPESIASRIIGTYTGVNFVGEDVRQLMKNK